MVRERFKSAGYESVALIPLRSGKDIIGLLQLNDSREERISFGMVRFFESIDGIIGVVLARIEAEEDLRRAKDELEERVQERTIELSTAKRSLEKQIQERNVIEEKLLMSQQRLELAMEASNLGSWDWNVDTDEVYFDQRWSTLFGYAADEMRIDFQQWQNRLHRDDKLKVLKTLERHIAHPSHYFECEYRLETKSGEWKWILDRGKVVETNENGKPVRMAGIYLDISDRKRTQLNASVMEPDCRSTAMRSALHSARLAAETDTMVLLMGESGAGKDRIAGYIHAHSKRANGPFFSINSAAVSPELAESELFGYESGAFTGSKGQKRGLLELAEGGTLLLNEIGELSLPLQAKLLTFLDTRQFTRVGGVRIFTVNARLIAATNRDLEKEVKLARFRLDLFFRLDVFTIKVPPLRQRTEDLPYLVGTILAELSLKLGLDMVPQIDPMALRALAEYSWPGNVRELRNVLERALILCDKTSISLGDLIINHKSRQPNSGETWSVTIGFPENESLNEVTMNLKRLLVVEALRRSGGSRKRAADLLGISPDSLKHYMQIFHLYTATPLPSGLSL